MSEASAHPSSSEWLQERLSALLASPHISFANLPDNVKRFMGHGPIDLFSTRFTNWFTDDAKGVIAGQEVGKDGLKAALLALQKRWHGDGAIFTSATPEQQYQTATSFTWTPPQSEDKAEITAQASVQEEGGTQRISVLSLDGNPALFSPE